jgi:hypothetical protein
MVMVLKNHLLFNKEVFYLLLEEQIALRKHSQELEKLQHSQLEYYKELIVNRLTYKH